MALLRIADRGLMMFNGLIKYWQLANQYYKKLSIGPARDQMDDGLGDRALKTWVKVNIMDLIGVYMAKGKGSKVNTMGAISLEP